MNSTIFLCAAVWGTNKSRWSFKVKHTTLMMCLLSLEMIQTLISNFSESHSSFCFLRNSKCDETPDWVLTCSRPNSFLMLFRKISISPLKIMAKLWYFPLSTLLHLSPDRIPVESLENKIIPVLFSYGA